MASRAQLQLVPFRAKGFGVARTHSAPGKGGGSDSQWLLVGTSPPQISCARYYGDIYNIPDEIGQIDVVVLGMVLPHLREPFYALAQTARLSKDAVIVTQQAPKDQAATAYFIPNVRMDPESAETDVAWWVFSQGCFREMLQVLGFEVESVNWQKHLCTGRDPAGEEENA
jgi:hypothetical protein